MCWRFKFNKLFISTYWSIQVVSSVTLWGYKQLTNHRPQWTKFKVKLRDGWMLCSSNLLQTLVCMWVHAVCTRHHVCQQKVSKAVYEWAVSWLTNTEVSIEELYVWTCVNRSTTRVCGHSGHLHPHQSAGVCLNQCPSRGVCVYSCQWPKPFARAAEIEGVFVYLRFWVVLCVWLTVRKIASFQTFCPLWTLHQTVTGGLSTFYVRKAAMLLQGQTC